MLPDRRKQQEKKQRRTCPAIPCLGRPPFLRFRGGWLRLRFGQRPPLQLRSRTSPAHRLRQRTMAFLSWLVALYVPPVSRVSNEPIGHGRVLHRPPSFHVIVRVRGTVSLNFQCTTGRLNIAQGLMWDLYFTSTVVPRSFQFSLDHTPKGVTIQHPLTL